jgi:hypothetical protein
MCAFSWKIRNIIVIRKCREWKASRYGLPLLVKDLKQCVIKPSGTCAVLYVGLKSVCFCVQYLSLMDTILLPRTFIPVFMGHCAFQSTNSVSLQKLPVAALYDSTHSSYFRNLCFSLIQPMSFFSIYVLSQANELVSNVTYKWSAASIREYL